MATYTTQLQQLYVAYYNRPADPIGLAYWESNVTAAVAGGKTVAAALATVSAAFASSAEYTAAYAGKNSVQIINTIYQNLFGRDAEPAGLTFWALALDQGTYKLANIVTIISTNALTTDKLAFDSKVAAATAFTNALDTTEEILGYSGPQALAEAKAFISTITDAATLAAAIAPAALNATVEEITGGVPGNTGTTYTLTTGADNIVGTNDNDTINGIVKDDDEGAAGINTFGPGDAINGGAGTDTLLITQLDNTDNFGDGFGAGATVAGVEILKMVEMVDLAASYDLSGFSGLQQIVVDKAYDRWNGFYNLSEELVSVTFDASRAEANERDGGFYFDGISDSLYTGTDDTLAINVINAGNAATNSAFYFTAYNASGYEVFENYSLTVAGDNNFLFISNLQDAGAKYIAKSITVANASGNTGSLRLLLDKQDALETIDASAMAGDFRFDTTNTVAGQDVAITSGAGDDNIILLDPGTFTIDTGTGDDRVALFDSMVNADQGDDVIKGGAGKDTLAVNVNHIGDADFANLAITGFEVLELTGAALAGLAPINVANYDATVVSSNVAANPVSFTGTNGKTITFTENSQGADPVAFASTGAADTLTLAFAEGAAGNVFNLSVANIETVNIKTNAATDDMNFMTMNISGVKTLSFAGKGNINFLNAPVDNASLKTLDLSAMEGVFNNNMFAIDGTNVDNLKIGNLGAASVIDFDAGSFSGLVTFGAALANNVTIEGAIVGVGGLVLNLVALGVTGFADINVAYGVGANAMTVDGDETLTITSSKFAGDIILMGAYTAVGDLDGAANFVFA